MRFHAATVMDRRSRAVALTLLVVTAGGLAVSFFLARANTLVKLAWQDYEDSATGILTFSAVTFACVLVPGAFSREADQGRYVIIPLRAASARDDVLYVLTRLAMTSLVLLLGFLALTALFLAFGACLSGFRLDPALLRVLIGVMLAMMSHGFLALVLTEAFRSSLAFTGSLLLHVILFLFRASLLRTSLSFLAPGQEASVSMVLVTLTLGLACILMDVAREKNW